jgi:hypothetical protein
MSFKNLVEENFFPPLFEVNGLEFFKLSFWGEFIFFLKSSSDELLSLGES